MLTLDRKSEIGIFVDQPFELPFDAFQYYFGYYLCLSPQVPLQLMHLKRVPFWNVKNQTTQIADSQNSDSDLFHSSLLITKIVSRGIHAIFRANV